MAIAAAHFVDQLAALGVRFVAGVPDTILCELAGRLGAPDSPLRHLVACNEGAAVAAAIGHHLASGAVAAVYLQNSGLGHAANPLASLAAPEVCSIPLLLLVGWRGELADDGTQLADEPQHRLQGRLTPAQLDLLGIAHETLGPADSDPAAALRRLLRLALRRQRPVALLLRRGTFAPAPAGSVGPPLAAGAPQMSREQAIEACLRALPAGAATVATTGMASRELFDLRRRRGEPHDLDFLVVGAMGHASHVALGLCCADPGRPVLCLDGDGAALMHLGALASCAGARGLLHVVLNNGAHESVGCQPTSAPALRLAALARACGYARVATVRSAASLEAAVRDFLEGGQSGFIEAVCRVGHRADLGRPALAPREAARQFMRALRRPAGGP